ncbi:MAG: nodulation protein NfeD [Firmicutes bacterium]|nr:nodulation protein NfeD [Bacillota bacterium]
MKRRNVLVLLFFVLLLSLGTSKISAVTSVYSLPIQGEIEPGLANFVARGLALAEKDNGILLMEINTFGGRVDAATEIKDLLIQARIPVIAYVTDRAWSAGALITLAAPLVAMAPGSSVGSAEPRPLEEKTVAALRAEFEATARRAGRDGRIAAAMVDADIEIEGLIEKGKILALSVEDALEWGFADVIGLDRWEVLAAFGYEDFEIIHLTPHWAEKIARFLTTSTVSSLLLTLGFLGLIVEITTPGWGVPGTGGLLALSLFFGGRYIAGLAGFEEIGLFIVGILLLAIEVFVIPGFGLVGILGILAVVSSIVLVFGNLQAAFISLSVALLVSTLALIFLGKRIAKTKFWQRLILSQSESKQEGYQGPPDFSMLLGQQGTALTPLRPAGTVVIGEQRFNVVSEGEFIDANSLVEVVSTEGSRVVVREIT